MNIMRDKTLFYSSTQAGSDLSLTLISACQCMSELQHCAQSERLALNVSSNRAKDSGFFVKGSSFSVSIGQRWIC